MKDETALGAGRPSLLHSDLSIGRPKRGVEGYLVLEGGKSLRLFAKAFTSTATEWHALARKNGTGNDRSAKALSNPITTRFTRFRRPEFAAVAKRQNQRSCSFLGPQELTAGPGQLFISLMAFFLKILGLC